jgi:hypothetical protein
LGTGFFAASEDASWVSTIVISGPAKSPVRYSFSPVAASSTSISELSP